MQQARKLVRPDYFDAQIQPARRLVSNPQPERKSRKVKLFFILTTCFLLCLTVIGQYSSLVILNYSLSGYRVELAEIRESTRTLEQQAAELGSIGRIETMARDQLGMIEPELSQVRVLTAKQGDGLRLGE